MIKTPFAAALTLAAALTIAGCVGKPGPVGNIAVPQPAKAVAIDQYLGRWYEYGRYEAPFQKGCEAVTADYSLRDGKSSGAQITVVNSCRQGSVDGKAKQSTGRAKFVEDSNGAKLKVSFFGPFYGDYWVLDRGENYEWSIVGEPSGRYLWMLTRTAKPDAETQALLKRRVTELGYDWSLVRMTQH